jgi:hypothetical protein
MQREKKTRHFGLPSCLEDMTTMYEKSQVSSVSACIPGQEGTAYSTPFGRQEEDLSEEHHEEQVTPSSSTSKNLKINHMLICSNRLIVDKIKPKDPQFSTVHSRLQEAHFSPATIGAIDGTHIPVVVPSSATIAHFGQYRETTQNVLAVCDFDMRFTFVVARWPGSVHGMRVFNEALDKYADKFPFPAEVKKY